MQAHGPRIPSDPRGRRGCGASSLQRSASSRRNSRLTAPPRPRAPGAHSQDTGCSTAAEPAAGPRGIIAGSCSSTCFSLSRSLGRPCVATATWRRRTCSCGSSPQFWLAPPGGGRGSSSVTGSAGRWPVPSEAVGAATCASCRRSGGRRPGRRRRRRGRARGTGQAEPLGVGVVPPDGAVDRAPAARPGAGERRLSPAFRPPTAGRRPRRRDRELMALDGTQPASWVTHAASRPGWVTGAGRSGRAGLRRGRSKGRRRPSDTTPYPSA